MLAADSFLVPNGTRLVHTPANRRPFHATPGAHTTLLSNGALDAPKDYLGDIPLYLYEQGFLCLRP
jgi:hypothetical protein